MVFALGVSGHPQTQTPPGQDVFVGEQHHSSQHPGGDAHRNRRAVVIGSDNNAHDICANLWKHDTEFFRALEAAGFRLDFGEDGSGQFLKHPRRGSGYYIDVGASQLVIDGGNLDQSRHYPKYLALQLKARFEGLPTPVYALQESHHRS